MKKFFSVAILSFLSIALFSYSSLAGDVGWTSGSINIGTSEAINLSSGVHASYGVNDNQSSFAAAAYNERGTKIGTVPKTFALSSASSYLYYEDDPGSEVDVSTGDKANFKDWSTY